jgi:hypothetical protein
VRTYVRVYMPIGPWRLRGTSFCSTWLRALLMGRHTHASPDWQTGF